MGQNAKCAEDFKDAYNNLINHDAELVELKFNIIVDRSTKVGLTKEAGE